jgi:hypothetical protein
LFSDWRRLVLANPICKRHAIGVFGRAIKDIGHIEWCASRIASVGIDQQLLRHAQQVPEKVRESNVRKSQQRDDSSSQPAAPASEPESAIVFNLD